MDELKALKRAVAAFLKSKGLEVFEDIPLPRITSSNISEVAVELYTTYRLLKSGKLGLASKMFPEGLKVDLLAWYEGRKVPAFAVRISERQDEGLAKNMDDLASYYKLVVHLEEAGPKRVGNVVLLSYRDLEEYIEAMLSFFTKR